MAPTLYMVTPSPAVRAVLITAKAIGVDLIQKEMNLSAGDHLTPEFIKINPQHTIPTLVEEDGFAVWDSHVIMTYLVSRYSTNDSLYPKDARKRAVVDERLYFELGVVFPRLFKIADPIIKGSVGSVEESDKDATYEIYGFLETFLQGGEWIAGGEITVADYSLMASITSLDVVVPIDCQKFPKLTDWFDRCQKLPEYEASKKGFQVFVDAIKKNML